MKKVLTMMVILLFIGLAFAPSINASVVEDELVEFDVEFCGLGKKHTVKLTQEEAEELELLFDEIEHQLSKVETREEAEIIFKDAVVELDKYGLLGGLSVRQAQRLVTCRFQNQKFSNSIGNLLSRNQESNEELENYFCLVAGKTNYTGFITIGGIIFEELSYIYMLFHVLFMEEGRDILANLVEKLEDIAYRLAIFFFLKNPFVILSSIIISLNDKPANGWIHTIGLLGIKSAKGEMEGNIIINPQVKIGIAGFQGIRILINYDESSIEYFYLGSAVHTNFSQV